MVQEKREGSHSPGHSRAHLSSAQAFKYQHTAAAAQSCWAAPHLHPELLRQGQTQPALLHPRHKEPGQPHPLRGTLWGPNISDTFCAQVSATHPCLLFAVGVVSAALYLPIITRKPRKWIRNRLPPRHLVLGSVLVLVKKE